MAVSSFPAVAPRIGPPPAQTRVRAERPGIVAAPVCESHGNRSFAPTTRMGSLGWRMGEFGRFRWRTLSEPTGCVKRQNPCVFDHHLVRIEQVRAYAVG